MPSLRRENVDTADQRCKLAVEYNNEGLRKYKKVDFDDAIEDFTKAIQCDDKLAAAYYNRGTVLYRLGIFDPALKDMIVAVGLMPDNKEFREGFEECQRIVNEQR